MELTLTGGSTLSDVRSPTPTSSNNALHHAGDGNGGSGPSAATTAMKQQQGTPSPHDHGGHNHRHGGQCCHAPQQPRPVAKIDASTLLSTPELVQRFRTDKVFRLNMLSNVVRGGPYALFTNLVTVLVLGEVNKSKHGEGADPKEERGKSDDAVLKEADAESLARMLDGYGADGHTLAHWCAKRGDEPRFLSFLMEKSHAANGARLLMDLHLPSKDAVGMYPLHWAVTEGAIPLVSMLLQHLEERPSPPRRPSQGNVAAPSSLMHDSNDPDASEGSSGRHNPSNAGIDARDASGCTPLLVASQYGHPDLAAFLIRRGADAHAVDSSRDTALHWAAYKGSAEVCGMLLHLLGAEGQLDATDAFGQTPLHLASLRGNAETVRFLMEEAGSVGERGSAGSGGGVGGALDRQKSAVGSKAGGRSRSFFYPGKLLSMRDKEEKTPRDLAIKKKKLGCEMLLLEYEEQYVLPKRSIISRIGRTCRDLCSLRSWKAWMGMSGADLPIGQSPTFPFYWMTFHIMMAGIFYATGFVGLGGRLRIVGDDALLWDKLGLHSFFVAAWIATWVNLYHVYTTNPGVLDASRMDVDGNINGSTSSAGATCQLLCFGRRAGYAKDRVSAEMDAVTKELRRQYDEIIESYSRDFPSPEKRVPLCHTCRIVKPLRSKHCRVARRCVLMFDHHCPFVGTTIGLYNYIYFYLFLVSFCLMASGFMTAWITFLKRSKEFPKGAFLLGGYFSMYLVPVAFMVFYHTTLMLNNSTTNEQMNARRYSYLWDESGRFHNPFDQGKIRNVLQRCWPDRSSYELDQHQQNRSTRREMELTGGARKGDEEHRPMLNNMV